MGIRKFVQLIFIIGIIIGGIWLVKEKFWYKPKASIVCSDCNIVLIEIDPLRADALSAYGNSRVITPAIDALAKNGFVFTQAYAVAPWTLPSAMSLMTGTYPSAHRITNKEQILSTKEELIPARLAPEIYTFAEHLKSNGYMTGGFAGGAALSASYGFSRGFDEYASGDAFDGLPAVVPPAINFIRMHQKEKFFVFIHGFDAHGQYVPSEGYNYWFTKDYTGKLTGSSQEQKLLREEGVTNGRIFLTQEDADFLRGIYDEKVVAADQMIRSVMSELRSLNLMGKTIIVFTSNHGDEFYEHGRIDHGMTLYDEVLHIPFIMTVPGMYQHKNIKTQVRNIDIVPTILDIIGYPPSSQFKEQLLGTSLVPAMLGIDMRLYLYAETDYRYATFKRAIRTWDAWKLITDEETQSKEVYNISNDPKEFENILSKDEGKEAELMGNLVRHMTAFGQKK